ncbi:MAG: hypothetical protein AVDCRST_MAG68-3961, partial [uncultured Gemmatimonadetes bacterium]
APISPPRACRRRPAGGLRRPAHRARAGRAEHPDRARPGGRRGHRRARRVARAARPRALQHLWLRPLQPRGRADGGARALPRDARGPRLRDAPRADRGARGDAHGAQPRACPRPLRGDRGRAQGDCGQRPPRHRFVFADLRGGWRPRVPHRDVDGRARAGRARPHAPAEPAAGEAHPLRALAGPHARTRSHGRPARARGAAGEQPRPCGPRGRHRRRGRRDRRRAGPVLRPPAAQRDRAGVRVRAAFRLLLADGVGRHQQVLQRLYHDVLRHLLQPAPRRPGLERHERQLRELVGAELPHLQVLLGPPQPVLRQRLARPQERQRLLRHPGHRGVGGVGLLRQRGLLHAGQLRGGEERRLPRPDGAHDEPGRGARRQRGDEHHHRLRRQDGRPLGRARARARGLRRVAHLQRPAVRRQHRVAHAHALRLLPRHRLRRHLRQRRRPVRRQGLLRRQVLHPLLSRALDARL